MWRRRERNEGALARLRSYIQGAVGWVRVAQGLRVVAAVGELAQTASIRPTQTESDRFCKGYVQTTTEGGEPGGVAAGNRARAPEPVPSIERI